MCSANISKTTDCKHPHLHNQSSWSCCPCIGSWTTWL